MFIVGGRNQQPSGSVSGTTGAHWNGSGFSGNKREDSEIAKGLRGHMQTHKSITHTSDERVSDVFIFFLFPSNFPNSIRVNEFGLYNGYQQN